MTLPPWPPGSEDDASNQHGLLGEDHQTRTIYDGDDGRRHVRCLCGWDSVNWQAGQS